MIAVLNADIIHSRDIRDPSNWIEPLKDLLLQYGDEYRQWNIVWGDSFQVELPHPQQALMLALRIKSKLKSIQLPSSSTSLDYIDVRIAIGMGDKTYSGSSVSESSGSAFIRAGDGIQKLKKKKHSIELASPWMELDDELNLFLKLLCAFVDRWTHASAELAFQVLNSHIYTQEKLGQLLDLSQSSISRRWNRANMDLVLEVIARFEKSIENKLLNDHPKIDPCSSDR